MSEKEQNELGITVAVSGKIQYYTQSLNRSTMGAGLYKMRGIRNGNDILPGFLPIEATNDAPLEIDNSVQIIVDEIRKFFTRQDIFKKMGFAHKRGYLLHGPPGCGKSSTLRLLQQQFIDSFQGIVLFWDNGSGLETWIDTIRDNEGNRPVMVVCEDIDSFVDQFEESILEFLDGQKALNNFVLVATTNSLKEIPSRIKDRPSRIDRVLEIGHPNEETRYKYLASVGVNEGAARSLAVRTQGLSIAQLKEIVVAVVCLEEPIGPVLERLKVADMSPIGALVDNDADDLLPF